MLGLLRNQTDHHRRGFGDFFGYWISGNAAASLSSAFTWSLGVSKNVSASAFLMSGGRAER